jgi:hypothetical protein
MSEWNLRLSDAPGRRPSITPDNAGRTPPPTSSPIYPYPLTVADDDRARVGARHKLTDINAKAHKETEKPVTVSTVAE